MDVWFVTKSRAAFLALCLLCAILSYPPTICASENLLEEIHQLDEDFKSLSARFYQDDRNSAKQIPHNLKSISALQTLVDERHAAGDDITAIRLLYNNESVVMDNLDNKAVFAFIDLLLTNNEWSMAERIHQAIMEEDDKSLTASVNYIFAKYYARRHQWDQVDQLLEGIFPELSQENATYAYLLKGVALQNLKKHRQAIEFYSKVTTSSGFYTQAQLNIATASIRLGLWTDANNIVQNILARNNPNQSDEIENRLKLILGYALLQHDYYRDARNAFRKVTLNSRYANRALLGIGLTAISQEDYIGGLNALSILKKKHTMDLSVDESYLVLPYVYNKLQQEVTVAANYNEAISYYQKRIKSLQDLSVHHHTYATVKYNKDTQSLIIDNNSLDYGNSYPEAFLNNYSSLKRFSLNTNVKTITDATNALLTQYDETLQRVIIALLNERIEFLKSYLNQARYGLAMLYDGSRETAQP